MLGAALDVQHLEDAHVHRRLALSLSAVCGWAVPWNRELVYGMGGQLRTHLHAVHRKMTLRSQQMRLTLAARDRYSTPQPRTHRAPG